MYAIRSYYVPEERMMSRVIQRGELRAAHIESLVHILADFYRQADGGGEIVQFGTAEAVAVNVLENFAQTEGFIGQGALSQAQFDRISARITSYNVCYTKLLRTRKRYY